jgi:hypothetical protein
MKASLILAAILVCLVAYNILSDYFGERRVFASQPPFQYEEAAIEVGMEITLYGVVSADPSGGAGAKRMEAAGREPRQGPPRILVSNQP